MATAVMHTGNTEGACMRPSANLLHEAEALRRMHEACAAWHGGDAVVLVEGPPAFWNLLAPCIQKRLVSYSRAPDGVQRQLVLCAPASCHYDSLFSHKDTKNHNRTRFSFGLCKITSRRGVISVCWNGV